MVLFLSTLNLKVAYLVRLKLIPEVPNVSLAHVTAFSIANICTSVRCHILLEAKENEEWLTESNAC